MRQTITKGTPNREYVTLAAAFDFFNRHLFGSELPPVIITLQRKARTHGYYSPKRFEGRGAGGHEADEIALNPGTFRGRSDEAILSTLVHEMVHHWQEHFGTPTRGRYHNNEWAEKMEAVGLVPSVTGCPGGRRTGQRVTHYTVVGGPFETACGELLAGGIRLEWQSRERARRAAGPSSKTKYTCPTCGINVWGVASLGGTLACVPCGENLVSAT